MEHSAIAIPGPLVSLLVHEAHENPTTGLLIGHVQDRVVLSVHDHSMDQHTTHEVTYEITSIYSPPTPWYDALGDIAPGVLANVLSSAQARDPASRIIGLYSSRAGMSTPSLRENKLWTLLNDGAAVAESSRTACPCVFLLIQSHTEDFVQVWSQVGFQRQPGDNHSAYRVPVVIPNMVQSNGLSAAPTMVYSASAAVVRAGADVDQSVAAMRAACLASMESVELLAV